MADILNKLNEYSQSGVYPFHMPGHKRMFSAGALSELYGLDITEIDGFDDLHNPEGIILDSMKRASELYQANETFFLVNGSTSGILSAISATLEMGQTLLIARNSHKSAYNGLYLRNARPVYIYPSYLEKYGIWGSINPEEVESLLIKNPECKAVFITSPTYEGIISDIKSIAEKVHKYGIPLIVDEAHGAHLGISVNFPDSAIHLGADIVIQSLHKTMPSPTQTALLHINGSIVDKKKIRKYLSIFQTSSPSYLLIAGIDEAIAYVALNKEQLFDTLKKNINYFIEKCKDLVWFELMEKQGDNVLSMFDQDPAKIVIFSKTKQLTGTGLMEILAKDYGLQLEMAGINYVVGILSIMDKKEGFDKLYLALKEIDKKLLTTQVSKSDDYRDYYSNQTKLKYLPAEAETFTHEKVSISNASLKIAAEYVYLYPPGTPILVPGEIIDEKTVELLKEYQKKGFSIKGIYNEKDAMIEVLYE